MLSKIGFLLWMQVALAGSLLSFAATAGAQTDMFIYPAKGQNQEQQDKDRYECHSWAVKQTGFDPSMPQAPSSQPSQQNRPSQPHILQGAGRGAALGAVGGAITGDAGKGAAAGAAMGGVVKECDKLTCKLIPRPPLAPGDRPTCARCPHACKVAVIRSIEMAKAACRGDFLFARLAGANGCQNRDGKNERDKVGQ
jgi:hypothetical protein